MRYLSEPFLAPFNQNDLFVFGVGTQEDKAFLDIRAETFLILNIPNPTDEKCVFGFRFVPDNNDVSKDIDVVVSDVTEISGGFRFWFETEQCSQFGETILSIDDLNHAFERIQMQGDYPFYLPSPTWTNVEQALPESYIDTAILSPAREYANQAIETAEDNLLAEMDTRDKQISAKMPKIIDAGNLYQIPQEEMANTVPSVRMWAKDAGGYITGGGGVVCCTSTEGVNMDKTALIVQDNNGMIHANLTKALAYADDAASYALDIAKDVAKSEAESALESAKKYTDDSIKGSVTQRVDFAGEFDGQKLPGAVGGITKIVFYANNYPVYEGTPLTLLIRDDIGTLANIKMPNGFSGNDYIIFDPGSATIEWYREDDYYQSINNDAFLSEMANANKITIYDSYAEATYADVTYMANLDGRFRQANHDAGVQAEEALTKANTYTDQAIKNIEVLLNNQPITTKTGETITVADSIGVVKKLIINGGFSYTGEPSIENPVDVSFTQNFTATGTDFSNTMDLSAYELKGNYSSAQANGIYDSIEVDYTQKTVKHIKRYHKYTFTQSSPIEYAGGGFESVERYRMKITHAGDPPCIPENWYYGYCNVLPIDKGYTFGYEKSCIGISRNMMYFKVQKSYGTDVAVIKDLLVEKGAYIWYPLETPVETDITETQIGKALLGIDFPRESFHLQTTGASGKHEMTYVQDINKVLEEMKNALTALGAVE